MLVEFIGLFCVIIFILLNIWKDVVVVVIIRKNIVGDNSGNVILKKFVILFVLFNLDVLYI